MRMDRRTSHPVVATGRCKRSARRRGFTLMESLMASAILFVVVFSVTSAITAGQQNAYEAHQRIAGTLAAGEMMDRLATIDYAHLLAEDGHREEVGTMTDAAGKAMPDTFRMVGRETHVELVLASVDPLDVRVRGLMIQVRSFNAEDRTLADLQRFVPEPQS